ncbi:MAG: hypothetical protein KF768_07025 [Phycisphaeraceae bacterium]|nr:hypothetical protein [Phycisphaeraceae bacterium]
MVACAGLGVSAVASSASADVTTVALSGWAAPGGGSFAVGFDGGSFSNPSLNNAGVVAFEARVNGTFGVNDRGIFAGVPGSLNQIARGGQAAPGAGGASYLFNANFGPIINSAGQVAFGSFLTGGGTTAVDNEAVFVSGHGLAARENSAAPGAPVNVNYGNFDSAQTNFSQPLVNDSGNVAFRSYLRGTGVNQNNDSGLWTGAPNSPQLLIREGASVGLTGFSSAFYGTFFGFSMNRHGQVAFNSMLTGAGTNFQTDQGIFSLGPNGNFAIAREGQGAPGAAGAQFGGAGMGNDIFDPVINDSGKVAFRSVLRGSVSTANNSGVWAGTPGVANFLQLVQRENNLVPGLTNIRYGSFDDVQASDPALNANGKLAMMVLLTGTGVNTTNNTAVVFGDALEIVVARKGDQIPDQAAGLVFGAFNDGFGVAPAMNDKDQLAFLGSLVGPGVDASNDRAIFGYDPSFGVRTLVREGDQLEVEPGDLRTIADLFFVAGSGGEDGKARTLNDNAQITFAATFTDGSAGVFVTSIPAPGAGLLALMGLAAVGRRRRVRIARGCRC